MSEPVKRLAVYSIQARDKGFKYVWAWGVCHAPIPKEMPIKTLDTFQTHGDAVAFAHAETAPAGTEIP